MEQESSQSENADQTNDELQEVISSQPSGNPNPELVPVHGALSSADLSPRSVNVVSAVNDVTQQTTEVPSNSSRRNMWHYRLGSCRNDLCNKRGFLRTMVFPAGTLWKLAEDTSNDRLLCVWMGNLFYSRIFAFVVCCMFLSRNPGYFNFALVLCLIYLVRWAVTATIRTRTRTYFDIEGSRVQDCAVSLCCERFVIHQASEEVKYQMSQRHTSQFDIPMGICRRCREINI